MGNSKATFEGVTKKLATALLRALPREGRSSAVLEQISTGAYKAVAGNSTAHPASYIGSLSGAQEFMDDYLAVNLIRKLDCLPTGIDTEAVARRAFLDAEDRCKLVNQLGKLFSPIGPDRPPLEAVIQTARYEMAKLLGEFSYNKVVERCSFSGGASSRLKRTAGHPFHKFAGKPHVTRRAQLAAVAYIWSNRLWREYCKDLHGRDSDPLSWVEVVDGGFFSTVPKDAKTDRGINIEPEMNMLLQKGAGSYIRQRLKRVGINLNDQATNQRLARIGSIDGTLATVDLSAASDSISIRIVRELLPPDWFDWLDRIRCHAVDLSGRKSKRPQWHLLEKFSAMGNGFTFELESAIFYCLSRAVVKHLKLEDTRLGIYGDDIVVSHRAVPLLRDVFSYVGFELNMSKSFWSGPFRESCGKHYYNGKDVTPFFVKHSLDTVEQLYWFVNSLRDWVSRRGASQALLNVVKYAITRISPRYRLYVPKHLGLKAGIWAQWDEASPTYCRRRQAYKIRVRTFVRRKHTINGWTAYLAALSAVSDADVRKDSIEVGNGTWRTQVRWVAWWD